MSRYGPSFSFSNFFFQGGGGIPEGIFFFTLNHCHDRIPYAGKAKCQTDVFILGNILPHCKSPFFRKCEIKQTYYTKPSNTLHISSWWLETHEQQTKTVVSLQSDFVTLTYARSLNCALPQSNYTLIRFLIKLLNMTSQFGLILSSLLGCKNSNVGIISKCHT